jgi:hypothetical protein
MSSEHLARKRRASGRGDEGAALGRAQRCGGCAAVLRASRLAGTWSHPNVVTVHDYVEFEGTAYIALG